MTEGKTLSGQTFAQRSRELIIEPKGKSSLRQRESCSLTDTPSSTNGSAHPGEQLFGQQGPFDSSSNHLFSFGRIKSKEAFRFPTSHELSRKITWKPTKTSLSQMVPPTVGRSLNLLIEKTEVQPALMTFKQSVCCFFANALHGWEMKRDVGLNRTSSQQMFSKSFPTQGTAMSTF